MKSATALLEEKYHKLVVDTHISFINAGADVIVTNNFSARRARMIENNVNHKFNYANTKAGELAVKAKKISIFFAYHTNSLFIFLFLHLLHQNINHLLHRSKTLYFWL